MSFLRASVVVSVLLLGWPARAEVVRQKATSFQLEYKVTSKAAPAHLYRALGQIGSWWNSQHTFSGKAANLTLPLESGGCFCEKWPEGSVQHGRVVQTAKDRLLRLQAPLGPLIELPVNAVLTFVLAPSGTGTRLEVYYSVGGDPAYAAGKWAAPSDKVLSEQIARLVRFAETGKAE